MVTDVDVQLVGEALVAEADAKAILDDLVEGLGCGNAGEVSGSEGEAVDDGVTDGWRFLTEDLAEALVGAFVTVTAIDVLEGYGEEAGGEQGGADVGQGDVGKPAEAAVAAEDVHHEEERDASDRREDRQELELGFVETVKRVLHVQDHYIRL